MIRSDFGMIETDPHDATREYIPLPAGWEIQTKGRGSSYRLLDRKTGDRRAILCNDGEHGREIVTRMAHEINDSMQKLVEALRRLSAAAEAAAWAHNTSGMDEAIADANAVLALVENADLPSYPAGTIYGSCVCGGWPGGPCLHCLVQIIKRSNNG